jgi:hypothetical protein
MLDETVQGIPIEGVERLRGGGDVMELDEG